MEPERWLLQHSLFPGSAKRRKGPEVIALLQGSEQNEAHQSSTVQLLSEGSTYLRAPEGLMDDARELDLHYIPSRYPNGLPGGFPHSFYGENTATSALQSARRILEAVTYLYTSENFSLET
ncbi:MAG: HEPN domain-containing protein [Syntrophobacteraceae bacterium]|nr:HEPN domain-containing protein [Syntrophobacteraceae bacterium]